MMKAIKIGLAVAVIAVIGFFIWRWWYQLPPSPNINPSNNQFITRIEREIDSLRKAPINAFCKEFYMDIQYRINDYYKQGFLGKTAKDNDQWKEILSKNLYTTYAPKFAEQAFYVFNGQEWKVDDLSFIRKEVIAVQNSLYLEQGSSVDNSFKNIRNILSKYDEISSFVSSCKYFSYLNDDIEENFPVEDVSSKVQKSRAYVSNRLDNSYVNNCARLKDGLHEIPQDLFDKHVSYLRKKIQQNSGRYREYNEQPEWLVAIYKPLLNQIKVLDNNIYGISDNTIESSRRNLEGLLSVDNDNAYEYFASK